MELRYHSIRTPHSSAADHEPPNPQLMTATARSFEDLSIAAPSQDGSMLRQAVLLAGLFALLKFALHFGVNLWQAHIGWGYFRDEMYYILCGQHLDWGYVDHGPIVAIQTRAAIALFGTSLAGIRMFSALAGAATVFLTGIIAWAIGGNRVAQALAMLGILFAPEFLGLDSFLSMNSFEAVFWMTAVLAILMLLRGASPRWWIVFAIAGGVGIENKPSMVVFLVALLVGLLLTPERRIVFSRAALIGVGVIVVLALPNLLWQIHNHYPTLEFIHTGKVDHKNVVLSPLEFMGAQVLMLNPISVFLWCAGVIWLLISRRSRPWRFLGWTYLVFVALMMATRDAKDYYLAAIYPAMFAAGGVCWQAVLKRRGTGWIVPAYATLLVITGDHCYAHIDAFSYTAAVARLYGTHASTGHSQEHGERGNQRLSAVLCRPLRLARDGRRCDAHLQRASSCGPRARRHPLL